jgi:hypothetical protein
VAKLGMGLDKRRRTEVVLNIKVGSKREAGLDTKLGLGLELGTRLDREVCTVLVLDIKLVSKLGTGLDRVRRTVLVLDIKLGSKMGTGLEIKPGT